MNEKRGEKTLKNKKKKKTVLITGTINVVISV